MSQVAKSGILWLLLVAFGLGSVQCKAQAQSTGDGSLLASSQFLVADSCFLEALEIEKMGEEISEEKSWISFEERLPKSPLVFSFHEPRSLLPPYAGQLQFLNIPPPQKA